MFDNEDKSVQQEYTIPNNYPATIFDDDAEEVREETKTRIGHCQKVPQVILDIGYKK